MPKKPETASKLRLSLIAFTLIALLGFGFWRQLYVERRVVGGGPESVQIGMTEFQVRWLLGAPHREFTKDRNSWGYSMRPSSFYLSVVFAHGKVKDVTFEKETGNVIPVAAD